VWRQLVRGRINPPPPHQNILTKKWEHKGALTSGFVAAISNGGVPKNGIVANIFKCAGIDAYSVGSVPTNIETCARRVFSASGETVVDSRRLSWQPLHRFAGIDYGNTASRLRAKALRTYTNSRQGKTRSRMAEPYLDGTHHSNAGRVDYRHSLSCVGDDARAHPATPRYRRMLPTLNHGSGCSSPVSITETNRGVETQAVNALTSAGSRQREGRRTDKRSYGRQRIGFGAAVPDYGHRAVSSSDIDMFTVGATATHCGPSRRDVSTMAVVLQCRNHGNVFVTALVT